MKHNRCTIIIIMDNIACLGLEPTKPTTVDKLQPNKVTNIDESGESDDSLPLELPTPPTSLKPKTDTSTQNTQKQQQKQDLLSPVRSNTDEKRKIGTKGVASPKGYSDDRRKPEYSEDISGHPSLQRTKHGSPHPGRAFKKQGLT